MSHVTPEAPNGQRSKKSLGPDPRLIVGGVIAFILLGAVAVGVIAQFLPDPEPDPLEVNAAVTVPAAGDPDGAEGLEEEPVPSYEPALPPPYDRLEVGANAGCDYDCLEVVSFDASVNGLRSVVLPANTEFRLRINIKNPSRFSALITEVSTSGSYSSRHFQVQHTESVDGVPVCPLQGDEPLALQPSSDTSCERVMKFVGENADYIDSTLSYSYLFEGRNGFEEHTGTLSSGVSRVEVNG